MKIEGDGAPAREGQDDLVPGTLFRKAWVAWGELLLRLARSCRRGACQEASLLL